jgi:uncharacterized Zn finger protein (UPF0148 family)
MNNNEENIVYIEDILSIDNGVRYELNLLQLYLDTILNENTIVDTSYNNILFSSLYNTNSLKKVITDEEIKKLKIIKYKDCKNKELNLSCSITQDLFKENDDIIELPCNHCFFVEPIIKWLSNEKAECPVCRYKFNSEEKNISENNENINVEQENQEQEENQQEEEENYLVNQNLSNYAINDPTLFQEYIQRYIQTQRQELRQEYIERQRQRQQVQQSIYARNPIQRLQMQFQGELHSRRRRRPLNRFTLNP